mgnify:CR=1 FL=1
MQKVDKTALNRINCQFLRRLKVTKLVEFDPNTQTYVDSDFDLSDIIRDRLAELNIEVRDTPEGAQWGFRTS